MHGTDPDLELWKRAQAREEEAFRLLRTRNGRLVRGELRQRLHDLDETTLQEMENGVWLAVWNALPQFRGASLFSTWVVAIVNHQACAHLRRKTQERKVIEAASQEKESEQTVEWESARLDHLALRQVLLKLPEQERIVISLRYFLQLTVEEVAQRSGIPLGTVKKRLSDGLAKLRAELRPPDSETEVWRKHA
jgi:RNA polymerase sigma-70 factor, ECF subfamily